MLKKNKKGFTLIEIIVVIVILAVLMAVAVPSVLKYINVAQEAPALTEAHAIVTAAQKRVIEKYSQNRTEKIVLDQSDNKMIEDFVNEGGTIQDAITITNNEITRLFYKASNGLYVLYENQKYTILDEGADRNSVIGILIEATELEKKEAIQKYLNQNPPNFNNASKELMSQYLSKNNNQFKGLSEREINTLKSKGMSTNTDYSNVKWKPIYTADGEIILVADTKGSTHIQNTMAIMLYYNGKYFYHENGSNKADSSFTDLGKLQFDENGVPISSGGKWVETALVN